jgi:hypothetical protein
MTALLYLRLCCQLKPNLRHGGNRTHNHLFKRWWCAPRFCRSSNNRSLIGRNSKSQNEKVNRTSYSILWHPIITFLTLPNTCGHITTTGAVRRGQTTSTFSFILSTFWRSEIRGSTLNSITNIMYVQIATSSTPLQDRENGMRTSGTTENLRSPSVAGTYS